MPLSLPSWASILSAHAPEGEKYLLRRRRTPVIDPSYGDDRLAAIRAAATAAGAGAWPEIRAVLAAAQDDEDLTFLVQGLQSVPDVERWIGDAVAADPGDPLPLLVSGARLLARCGYAGVRRPPQASGEQAEIARIRLESAEEQLMEVTEREPGWAAPWYFLMATAGASTGAAGRARETSARRFASVVRRAPGHAAAHRLRLAQLSPAWAATGAVASTDGTDAQDVADPYRRMHAFARRSMLDAPEGSRLGELVALAHLEQWRDLGADPDSGYLSREGVIAALREAAVRSVLHPAFDRRRDWALAANAFAMAFALAGDYAPARTLFRRLGPHRTTETPWHLLDERSPLLPFRTWRTRVGA